MGSGIMAKSAPSNTHLKPFLACAALIGFALGYSWALPFVHVSCIRDGERVECVVQEKMLALITYQTTKISDLQKASLGVEQGTRSSSQIETTDSAYLTLLDADGSEKSFLLESIKEIDMTRPRAFAQELETFLHSDDPVFSNWTVSLLGYGALVPAFLGLLFLALVAWDYVGSKLKAE